MNIRSLFIASVIGFSSTIALAQTAAIDAATQKQLDTAISKADTATIAQLAAANPQAAVTIAQRVANAAQAAIATKPGVAATLAAAATEIITKLTVINALASNTAVAKAVGDVALTASQVIAAEAVRTLTSTDVIAMIATVATNATTLAENPAVQTANFAAKIEIPTNVGLSKVRGLVGGNISTSTRSISQVVANTPPLNLNQLPRSPAGGVE